MPQAEKAIIRSLLDPTIVLDSMEVGDLDTGTSEQAKSAGQEDTVRDQQISKDIGTNYPFVEINNYVFNQNQITNFEIDYAGFIPTLRMTVGINNKTFGSASFPKDGDLISVFIRAKNNAFKPIRNDYRITSIRSSGGGSEGSDAFFYITGELFVPHLYDEVITSFNGTSYNALKEVARTLGLGFASNDDSTDDEQIWISPRSDYYTFILDVAERAWKDEKSFFDVFIDVYYNLNFINVNNQFSEDDSVDLQLLTNLKNTDSRGGEKSAQQVEDQTMAIPKVLSNYEDLYGTPAYVHKFDVENNANSISEEFGYKTYRQFFEQNSEQYWSIYVEPLTTEGAEENKIILKGRAVKPGASKEEFWKTQNRYVWEGIQYSAPEGNCHENYTYAKGWNERNNAELQKMIMKVKLERGNFNIYRGERLPLLLLITTDPQMQLLMSPPEQKAKDVTAFPEPILDKFNSGYYMISGMRLSYSPSNQTNSDDFLPEGEETQSAPGFTHTIFLTRREWPTPV
jgi:hypothetical protein